MEDQQRSRLTLDHTKHSLMGVAANMTTTMPYSYGQTPPPAHPSFQYHHQNQEHGQTFRPPPQTSEPNWTLAHNQTQTQAQAQQEPERFAFHISSKQFPQGKLFYIDIPPSTSQLNSLPPPLPRLKCPRNPMLTQSSLLTLQSCILYVQFPCAAACRTKGICIHFQFMLGVRGCMDGMICDPCAQEATEEMAVVVGRACPLHQHQQSRGVGNGVGSRAEDFLAGNAWRERAREVLSRAGKNNWGDLGMVRAGAERERTPMTIADVRGLQLVAAGQGQHFDFETAVRTADESTSESGSISATPTSRKGDGSAHHEARTWPLENSLLNMPAGRPFEVQQQPTEAQQQTFEFPRDLFGVEQQPFEAQQLQLEVQQQPFEVPEMSFS